MQALINGTMYRLQRLSERLAIGRASTMRSRNGKPVDVTIMDLSVDGCRISTPTPLIVGDEIMIGLPGVGTRSCKVAWVTDTDAGCEFEIPLSLADVQETTVAQTLMLGHFADFTFSTDKAHAPIEEQKFSARHRLLIIVGTGIITWAVLALIAAAVL